MHLGSVRPYVTHEEENNGSLFVLCGNLLKRRRSSFVFSFSDKTFRCTRVLFTLSYVTLQGRLVSVAEPN